MINMNTEFGLSVLFDGFLAAIAAIGFAVISNPPKKAVFIAALLAAVGHACRYYLLHQTPLDLTLLPMIPGMYAYKTILALIRFMKNDDPLVLQQLIVEIFRNGLTALFVLFALVIGVSLPLFIFYKQSFMMTRLLHRKKSA